MRKTILTLAMLSTMSAVAVYAALPQQPAAEASAQPRMARNVAPQTRAEAIAKAREQFAMLDKNKDGFVTRDELPQMPNGMAAPMPAAAPKGRAGAPDRLFTLMDKNGDGTISRAEFDAFYGKGNVQQTTTVTQGPDGKDMREQRVIVMHSAGDGATPATGAMPPLPPIEPGRMAGMMFAMRFDRIDTDHDGKISAAEAEAAAGERFDRLDTNHDGILTAEERTAGMPRIVTRSIRVQTPDTPKPSPDK